MQAILTSLFTDIPKEASTFFMAMIPAIELKASIPVAILKFKLAPQVAFLWSFLGSLTMGILFFILFRFLFERFFARIKFVNKIWKKSIGAWRGHKNKFGIVEALIILFFMIVPLPGFGSFLGAIVAAILRTDFNKAISYLIWGNFLAGGIILLEIFGLKL
jgi:uncharacterized membrane protein